MPSSQPASWQAWRSTCCWRCHRGLGPLAGGQATTSVAPSAVRTKKSGTTLRSRPRARHLIFAGHAASSVTDGSKSSNMATASTFIDRQPTCLPVVAAHHQLAILRCDGCRTGFHTSPRRVSGTAPARATGTVVLLLPSSIRWTTSNATATAIPASYPSPAPDGEVTTAAELNHPPRRGS